MTRRRLGMERLETRDVPAGIWYQQNFDSTPIGATPNNWAQWANDGASAYSVSLERAVSGAQSLQSSGTSARTSVTWYNQSAPADLEVSANIYADSLIPVRLLIRGSNLNSATPTYYAATLTRGLSLELNRVVGGADTKLAQLASTAYTSGIWVRMTLSSQGSALRVRVQRLDSGAYLAADGRWVSAASDALTIQDAAIAGAGFAGIGRPARYAGNVAIDDFEIATNSADTQPPKIVLKTPEQGAAISGYVSIRPAIEDNDKVARVEFWLNNQLRLTQTDGPYSWTFNSTIVPNGPAILQIRAYDPAGNVGTLTRTFMVNNAFSLPEVPRHYSHIRIAQLAYSGTPMSTIELDLLRNSVDLVIPNEQYLAQINAVAPNTPQLIYTNVSNIYGSLLTDWLTYADRNELSREAAFYHVAQPTAFTGGSPSSQPVNWLWDVRRETTNLTYAAHDSMPADVAFGGAGQSLYLGYTDRFRELNFTMSTASANGWSGVLEYATAVNAAGQPTAWQTLSTVSDGTLGFRQSGRITFDPPANWVAAKLNGAASLFYIRVRTTSGGTTPVASTILGRDFVNAVTAPNGSSLGTIPAFDSAADLNHDGYLSDAEYSQRASGKDARFFYESRLFYPYYGPMRFVLNPAGVGAAAWAADYNVRFLNANPLADGLFVDNSNGRSPLDGAVTVESAGNFAQSYANLLGTVRQAVAPRWLMANTSGFYSESNVVIPQVQSRMEEFLIRALAANYSQFEDVAGLIRQRQALTNPSQYVVLDTLPTSPTAGVGSSDDPTGRTQLATLAYYYMVADPQNTFLMMNGGYEPASSWARHWSAAVAFDVGQPVGDWSVRATGADPSNAALTYKVYQRQYSNALILYKPLSYRQGVGTGTAADNTATMHALGGNYRALRNDGTLGPVITSISLRNGEGAILVRA